MAKYEFPHNVEDIAKVFDKERPGWERNINLATLDLASWGKCPMGQVFGRYSTQQLFDWFGGTTNGMLADNCYLEDWKQAIQRRLDTGLSLGQAIEALQAGKNIRHRTWSETVYIRISNGELVDNSGLPYSLFGAFVVSKTYSTGWSIATKRLFHSLEAGTRFKVVGGSNNIYTKPLGGTPYQAIYDGYKLAVLTNDTIVEIINNEYE